MCPATLSVCAAAPQSSGRTLWRRKSWGGVLMQAPGWEAKAPAPHARGLPYRRQTSTFLPPLKSLPPPPSLSLPPAANIDLYVDFETELKPFLSTCLVSCQPVQRFI